MWRDFLWLKKRQQNRLQLILIDTPLAPFLSILVFFISSDPENLQSSPPKIRKVSVPILSKFSEIMNNL